MAFDSQKRVAWMKELIEKNEDYNMPPFNNCVVCIGTSSEHPFRVEEISIIYTHSQKTGRKGLFWDRDVRWSHHVFIYGIYN